MCTVSTVCKVFPSYTKIIISYIDRQTVLTVLTVQRQPRFNRRSLMLAVVLVAMRVCHRSLRRLATWADRLRV